MVRFLICVLLCGCGGSKGNELYRLTKTRVVAAQVFRQQAQAGPGDVGCKSLPGDTVSVYCLQYPVRPGTTVQVQFLLLAPSDPQAQFSLVGLQQAPVQPGALAVDIPLTGFTKNNALSVVHQSSPVFVQSIVYDLAAPSVALTPEGAPPPLYYSVSYEVQSLFPVDRGFFAYHVLPEATDPQWTALTSVLPASLTALLAPWLGTNVPSVVAGVSSSAGTDVSRPTSFTLDLASSNPSPRAKSRIQWYVTQGDLDNEHASPAEYTPQSGGGPAGAVGVIRDLIGGADWGVLNFVNK